MLMTSSIHHCIYFSPDPNNHPGWSVPENQKAFMAKLPLFIKPLLLDVTKLETKVRYCIHELLIIHSSVSGLIHVADS